MSTVSDEFAALFRSEHRKVRDLLLTLVEAFQRRDIAEISSVLDELAFYTGPHFRYEEEELYPRLVPFYGDEYVDGLYSDHDRAIARVARMFDLARLSELSDENVAEAMTHARSILGHVSDCDGLSIMIELMTDAGIESIMQARTASIAEGMTLLEWADSLRRRKLPVKV
ncbi:MAG: hemerythrin domain-containing protein [Gaiellaceae bacterium]